MNEEQRLAKAARQKAWYEKNKEQHMKNVSRRRAEAKDASRKFLQDLKEATPCTDCKEHYPYYVMDFDHLYDKQFKVSMMPTLGYSLKKIKEEIAKCEIVCANCHRKRTHERQAGIV